MGEFRVAEPIAGSGSGNVLDMITAMSFDFELTKLVFGLLVLFVGPAILKHIKLIG